MVGLRPLLEEKTPPPFFMGRVLHINPGSTLPSLALLALRGPNPLRFFDGVEFAVSSSFDGAWGPLDGNPCELFGCSDFT